MQYGVGGAHTNALANLLVFASNSSQVPTANDFSVQLGNTGQAGNVSVLSTYSSPLDYLIRVSCTATRQDRLSWLCWWYLKTLCMAHLLLMPAYSACIACCTIHAVSPSCSMFEVNAYAMDAAGLSHVAPGSVHVLLWA